MVRSEAEQSTLLQTFIDSRNEVDRSIFLSASGGVAFCAAMLFNAEYAYLGGTLFAWLVFAMVMFGTTAALVLWIFRANSSLVQRLLADDNADPRCPLIERLEKSAIACFITAVVAIGGAVVAFHFNTRNAIMSENDHVTKGLSGIPVQRPAQSGNGGQQGSSQGSSGSSSGSQSSGSSSSDTTQPKSGQ